MGTFTVAYWARKTFWDKKHLWAGTVFAYWLGTCWDRAGIAKASMMKGHSRMFADRAAAVPAGKDVWKW